MYVFYEQQDRIITRLFGAVTLTIWPGFYPFQVNNRITKNTRARCEMYLKLTGRTAERRQ